MVDRSTLIAVWRDGALQPVEHCDPAETTLLVSDAWRVDDGLVRALERHRERFFAAVEEQGGDTIEAQAFWSAAVAETPSTGSWVPRVELRDRSGGRSFWLRRRPAPERRTTLAVASHNGQDGRRAPLLNGPDHDWLVAVRLTAQARGADEGVLLKDGAIVSGASTALLWWRDGALHRPPATTARVPSITERLVVEVAALRGVPVREEEAGPRELEGCEVWAVDAVHGIRVVDRWVDGPTLLTDTARRDRWERALGRLADAHGAGWGNPR